MHLLKIFCSRLHIGVVDTIFALASGALPSAIAVIRVSGHDSNKVFTSVAGNIPSPNFVTYRNFHHPVKKNIIDKGLCVFFKGPKSYTGEDSCEFYLHGGIAVVSAMYDALSSIRGVRVAENGEFTKRAFLNGKLDLTEAEAVADLIAARSEEQRKQALSNLAGGFRRLVNKWRSQLLSVLVSLEAYLDFSEDQVIEDNLLSNANDQLKKLKAELEECILCSKEADALRNGIKISIVGKPNVGKSTLFNIITKKPSAIVSPFAGTTRDVIESITDIDGFPVSFCDTAGFNASSTDPIEQEGIRRAVNRALSSDFVIFVVDAMEFISVDSNLPTINDFIELEILHCLGKKISLNNTLVVINKLDTISSLPDYKSDLNIFPTSCISGQGVDDFLDKLKSIIKERFGGKSGLMMQNRHRSCIQGCINEIEYSLSQQDCVLVAEGVRKAAKNLAYISGDLAITSNLVLENIFKNFCVGK